MLAAAFNRNRNTMEENPTIFPTWGYKPDGSAQIFNLREEDEDLPKGWSRQPELWNHPNTAHLYSRPAGATPEPDYKLDYDIVRDEIRPKKRGRPPNAPRYSVDEQPGAELASELRDE